MLNEDGSITVDPNMSVADAVKAWVASRERLSSLCRAEDSVEPEVSEAFKAEKAARTQAQYSVKVATGYYPYELALMGL